MSNKEKQRVKDLAAVNRFYYASMSALCHCYDNTQGFYPDKCDCATREHVHESMQLIIEEHKRLLKELELD